MSLTDSDTLTESGATTVPTADNDTGVIVPEPFIVGESNPVVLRRLLTFVRIAAAVVVILGASGLLGWLLVSERMTTIVSGHAPVRPNTLVAFIAAGCALWLLERIGLYQRVGQVLAGSTVVIGGLTSLEYLFHIDLKIDALLFAEQMGRAGIQPRMAWNTAVAFVALGAGLLFIDANSKRRIVVSQSLAIAGIIVSMLALLGYTFGVPPLYRLGYHVDMSLPAAVAFAFLSVGLLCAQPQSGLMRLVSSVGIGGVMLRRFLPLAVAVPWVLGWLTTQGQLLGLYSTKIDQVLLSVGLMVAFSLLIYGSSKSLERTDAERRRAEESLRRSRDQWELTFNCMSEGMSYHDPDYNVVGYNKAIRELLPEIASGAWKCYELVHGTNCPPDYCPMQKTLATGRTESSEFFEPRINKHLLVRTDPVRDEFGKITRVVHVVEDITERKQAERAIGRLAAIVQSSDDAIIGKDLDGIIQSWNAGARRIYGYEETEVVGKSIGMLCPPEVHDDWREVVASVREGKPVEAYETVRVRKDGSRLFVSLSVSPIRDSAGSMIGVSTIARDITERKRAEEERARLLQLEQEARRLLEIRNAEVKQLNAELEERVRMRTAELEASNKELEAFSYSVSHDLRAPLRSIDGFSHILLDEYRDKLDAEGQDFLGRVRAASQHMGVLIDALLQLSRVSRSEMKQDQVNLSEMAKNIASELRKTAPERDVEFRIAEGAVERGDARLLEVAIRNLLGNAWKFTSKRTKAVIEFGTAETDGKRTYFVRDNGAGFDMEYGDKLFGAFQRLHTAAEFEGSGIGLATVQRILRRHGGHIWAEGATDKGATFYFNVRG